MKLSFPILTLAAMLLASVAARAESPEQAAADKAVQAAIERLNLAAAADKAVADAIVRADLAGRADAAVAAALAKLTLPAAIAVAPAGAETNPFVNHQRYWFVRPDGSRTACDASGNALGAALGAATGVCTINADGSTSCSQTAFSAYSSGAGGCASGQCGAASGRVGIFRRR